AKQRRLCTAGPPVRARERIARNGDRLIRSESELQRKRKRGIHIQNGERNIGDDTGGHTIGDQELQRVPYRVAKSGGWCAQRAGWDLRPRGARQTTDEGPGVLRARGVVDARREVAAYRGSAG